MLSIISALIVCEALALSMLVGSRNSSFSFVATLGFLTVEFFMCILILFSQMAIVYQNSSSSLWSLNCKHDSPALPVWGQKWERRFYKSCSPLKIRISSANFVDKLTPLNMLALSMSYAANLLMVNGSNI